MTINSGEYYDFDDVMIRPQLSNKAINSRDDVSLIRPFAKNEDANRPYAWSGTPIIAANMDTIGTMEMAEILMEYDCCTALHKHYSVDSLVRFFAKHREREHLLFYTMGINDDSVEKFTEFTRRHGMPKNICIDVANGYAPRFIEFISKVRDMAPDSMIMAGNVVTGDVTYALINAGASIIKVGIGSGCFAPGNQVLTSTGNKNIEDVNIGDYVLTHKNRWKRVVNTLKFSDKKEIMKINDITVTPNHEFFVVHKRHKNVVTEENISDFAEWIPAKNLTKDYLLVQYHK